QTLRREPESRILLTSQTHAALDNSLERITAAEDVRAVRIGHEDDERIASTMKALLLDRRLPVLKRSALAQGRQFLEAWAARNGVDMIAVRMAMELERRVSFKDRLEQVEARIDELRLARQELDKLKNRFNNITV